MVYQLSVPRRCTVLTEANCVRTEEQGHFRDMDNDGTIRDDLYRRAQESEQVILPGGREDVERYYAASDIFVSPSYREGFGLVIIEAEAMGLPAIASNVPGQIDAIVPNVTGLLCEVKDADSLREAMERLLEDDELRSRMGSAAEKYARECYEQKELFKRLMEHRIELLNLMKERLQNVWRSKN